MPDCCSINVEERVAPRVMPCPVSGTRSKQVDMITVKSLVRHLRFGMPPAQYYFCAAPGCDVVYFPLNPAAPSFRRADLQVEVGVKKLDDPIPLCYCFGVTREDIRNEVRQSGKSSAAERITAEVKADKCACEVKNPSGKCCMGDVTRAIREAVQTLEAR